MRQAEFDASFLYLASKAYGRVEVCRQRLIADDVESGIHRQRTNLVVTVIWCHYGDNVDTVCPFGFVFDECLR